MKLHIYFKGGSDIVIPVEDWTANTAGANITKLSWTNAKNKATLKFIDVTEIVAIVED